MPRRQAQLPHGCTSACLAQDELLKLNLGFREPFLRGLLTRLRRRGGVTHACNAIIRVSGAAEHVRASLKTSGSALTWDARRAGRETSRGFIGA